MMIFMFVLAILITMITVKPNSGFANRMRILDSIIALTTKIYGNYWSSFSEVAAEIGGG